MKVSVSIINDSPFETYTPSNFTTSKTFSPIITLPFPLRTNKQVSESLFCAVIEGKLVSKIILPALINLNSELSFVIKIFLPLLTAVFLNNHL
jgi:hypothetical protein